MRLPRITFLAACLALSLGLASAGAGLRAQAPQPAPQAVQTQPAAGPAAEPAESGEGHGGHAGHHPEVKLFGHSLGTLAQFGVMVFNFALFAGLLFFLLKGALASAFQARRRELEEKLSQAERDKAEAERQIQELENRMAGLQAELAGIMAKAEVDAEAEKERILEAARTEAAQILAQTRAEIDSRQRAAEAELRALVADLVVTGAARRLEGALKGQVADRALDRAIDQVGGGK
jgi:F-type H+-transporting ATPase subunit b